MNLLFLGPQGSGKGTQARLICEKYNLFYFEAGAFLRELATKNENLRESLAKGQLVPDEEMTSYVSAFFDNINLYDNIVFDGFPRTVKQYAAFKSWLADKQVTLDLVFVLNITEAETVKRLSARRMDAATSKIYNLVTDPPPQGIDVNTLVQREDDKPQAIKKRLKLYQENTLPLIKELNNDTKVFELDGDRPVKEILNDIVAQVEEKNATS